MTQIEWNAEAAEKGGFEHFMMKEIHEQPKAVTDTLNSVLKNGRLDLTEMGLTEEEICAISQIYIVACGSAYHVGAVARYVMEDLAEIPVRVMWLPNSVTENLFWIKWAGDRSEPVRRDGGQSGRSQGSEGIWG